jgi:hypothetical protein
MIIFRWILLRMRNTPDKFIEKIKTQILCSINVFRKSCLLINDMKNYGTARKVTYDNIIGRMRFACRITKAAETHSNYEIIIASPRQKWLCERASMSRYTNPVYLVMNMLFKIVLFICPSVIIASSLHIKHFASVLCKLQTQPISDSLIWSPWYCKMNSEDYEVPRYATPHAPSTATQLRLNIILFSFSLWEEGRRGDWRLYPYNISA